MHFGIHADALRGMLNRLIRKGRVQKLPTPKRCHHCVDCSQESLEFYEWITDEQAFFFSIPHSPFPIPWRVAL
ncbi:MAG: FeoC-like transcriptional regulator [Coleofasciculus sp. B1-GNL1-01]|uniref:FeoC-like transcriptional regulator n=1 Tax=Coleofasciculus sp. B1-GNL1-01 TaxID=3068484 RepID=UPI0032F77021